LRREIVLPNAEAFGLMAPLNNFAGLINGGALIEAELHLIEFGRVLVLKKSPLKDQINAGRQRSILDHSLSDLPCLSG
jgi:hypothetical protein